MVSGLKQINGQNYYFNDKYFKLPIVDGAENKSRVPSSYDNFILDFNKLMSVAKNYPYDYMNNTRYCIGKFDGNPDILDQSDILYTVIDAKKVKELILNALIHQDFTIDGSGVMIECFSNRIEITNPGAPLIDVNKIADSHHLSRNPKLVNLMDKLGFNNDLTAGWDTVIQTCEKYCLPAPGFKIFDEFTQVTVYPPTEFKDISFDEKLWTCFLHALYCLKQNEFMTKSSLKKRFGLKSNQNYSISKLIKSAIDKNLLAIVDPTVTSRYLKFRLGSKYNLK